jgi:hypothetical protein
MYHFAMIEKILSEEVNCRLQQLCTHGRASSEACCYARIQLNASDSVEQ